MDTRGYTLDEVAKSRQNYMHGFIEHFAESSPWTRVDEVWKLAVQAAEAAFPLPPSEDEVALFAQLDDIEVN